MDSLGEIARSVAGQVGLYGDAALDAVHAFQDGLQQMSEAEIRERFGDDGGRIALLLASAPRELQTIEPNEGETDGQG